MMNEYKGLINKTIINSYSEALVIDVMNDKTYRYLISNSDFSNCEELSYMEYLESCKKNIFTDDVDNYIEALSIAKLEEENDSVAITYKMKDSNTGVFTEFISDINLYDDNGKKLIVVLTSHLNNKQYNTLKDDADNNIETKLNKIVDSVSLAILKIHNIVNNSVSNKEDLINPILASLTTEFPEFSNSLNNNMKFMKDIGKSTIMIIDDDNMTCNLIKKVFENKYNIILAHNGTEAIEMLKKTDDNICCVFLDLIMPVLDGFGVLDYLSNHNYLSKIPVIIISGNYDKETRNKAYSYRIADMLEKPFNVQVVRHRIENLITLYNSNNSLNEVLTKQHRDLKNIVNSIIAAYEFDNMKNMNLLKEYTRILATQVALQYPEYNLNENLVNKIANSATYYAIGNWTLPKTLLYKKTLFNEDERSIINMSNLNGANIVKYVLAKNNNDIDANYCYDITKNYNERYDGNGYPQGLSGNSIPIAAQIASLAIEYNNLINTIVPVDYEKVASLIMMESGRKFNPKIVDSFKKVKNDFESITKVGI